MKIRKKSRRIQIQRHEINTDTKKITKKIYQKKDHNFTHEKKSPVNWKLDYFWKKQVKYKIWPFQFSPQ